MGTYIKKKTKADLDSERTNTMHKTANNEMINKTLTKPPFNVKLSPMATTAPPEPIKKKVESYEDIEEMAGIVLDEISSELTSEKEHNEIDDDPEKKEILLQEKYTFNPIERMNTMHKVTDNEMINESKAPTKPSFNVKVSSMATTAIPELIQKKVESAEDLEEMSKVLEQMAEIVLNEIVPELLSEKEYIKIDGDIAKKENLAQEKDTIEPTKADFQYERTNTTPKDADNEMINETDKVKLSSMATTTPPPEPIQKIEDSDEDLEEKSKVLEQMAGIVLNEIAPELLSEKQHNEIDDVTTRSKSLIQGTNTNKPTKADFEYERINTKHKIADNEIINESKAPTKPPVKVKLSAMATTAIPEPLQKKGESDEDLEEKSKSLEQMSGIVLNEIVDELLSEKKHNEIYDVSTRSKGFIQGTNANKQTKADFEHGRTNTFHKATDNEIINETKAPTKPPGKVKITSMATTAIPEPIHNKGYSDEDLEELDQMAGIVLNEIVPELLSEKEYKKKCETKKKKKKKKKKYTIKPTKADFEYERTNTMHKAVDNEIINQKEAPIEPPFNAKLTSKATIAKTPAPTHEKEDSDEDQEEMSIILEQMAELELNEIVPELLSKNEYNEIVDDNAAKNRDYVKQARKLHTENWTNIHNENDQDGKSHKASFKPMEKYTTETIINASPKTVLQHTVTINNIEPSNKAVKAPEPGITVYETAANLSEENDNMSMIGQLAGTVINEIFTDILEDDSKVNKNNPSIQNEAVPKTKMGVSTVLYNGISNEINKKNTNDMQNGVLFTVKAKSSRANKIKVAEHPNKVEQNYKTFMKMENKDKMSVNESNKKNPSESNETRSSSDKKIGSIESINPNDTTDKKFNAVPTTT